MDISIHKLSELFRNQEERERCKGKLVPLYHDTIQIIHVQTEYSNPFMLDCKELDGSFICLKDIRPELFIRRDFIKDFILQGKVYLVQDKNSSRAKTSDNNYYMYIKNNIFFIILTGHQYRRFGLIGQKKLKNKKLDFYEVKIDLKDERIMRSNKYQDKLVEALRRLDPINKVYLRWCPHKADMPEIAQTTLKYFDHVIEEYKIDGFKPVPLKSCYLVEQKYEKTWMNRAQNHPPLNMNMLSKEMLQLRKNGNKSKDINKDILEKVKDIVDWLGYQLLSLDCNQEEIWYKYNSLNDNETCEPYNVYCSQISGIYDSDLIEVNLRKLLERGTKEGADSPVFSALFLYNRYLNDSNNDQVTILLQDYSISSSKTLPLHPNDIHECTQDQPTENLTTVIHLTCNNT